MHKSNLIQSLKAKFLQLIIMTILMVIYGCLALPVPYRSDDPFPQDKFSFIIPGTTTKNTVKEKLGTPWAYRFGEKIYIYAGGQRDWVWLWFIGAGYTGAGGTMPTYLTHLLIIEFDKNDIVTAVQEFCGDSGGLESGLYVVDSGGYCTPAKLQGSGGLGEIKRDWRFSNEQLILRASPIMDKKAKQFLVPSDKSVIYYYKRFSHYLEVKLNNTWSVDSGTDGFLIWIVDPGDYKISTSHDHHPESLTIRCNPGATYYIEHREGILREEHKSFGEKEISKRHLVCDRIDPFDLTKNNTLNSEVSIDFKDQLNVSGIDVKSTQYAIISVETKVDKPQDIPTPQVTPIEIDKIKSVLLRPGGWDVDWSGPGRIGEGDCLFETRGEKVVAKISIIDKPVANSYCERDVIISADGVKFDSCRHSGITLQFDLNDPVYPFKGRSAGGVEYKLKAK